MHKSIPMRNLRKKKNSLSILFLRLSRWRFGIQDEDVNLQTKYYFRLTKQATRHQKFILIFSACFVLKIKKFCTRGRFRKWIHQLRFEWSFLELIKILKISKSDENTLIEYYWCSFDLRHVRKISTFLDSSVWTLSIKGAH